MRTLETASVGDKVIVESFASDAVLRGRIVAIGIIPGTELEVIQKERGHPILLRAGNAKVAIDVATAKCILIREGDDK